MSVSEHGHVDHMTDFEALMWELEKSPALSNTFSNVTIWTGRPTGHG